MDFNLSEEQALLRDSAARYLRDKYPFDPRGGLRGWAEPSGDKADWQVLAELGWLGLSVPQAQGGYGLGFVEDALVLEEFGRALAPAPFLGSAVLCTPLLRNAAASLHQQALVQGLVQGSTRFALAHLEPEVAGCATRARCLADGWELQGRKLLALAAPQADVLLITASDPDAAGATSLFAVPATVPGVHMRPYRLVDGQWAADVVLESVRIGAQECLAGPLQASALLEEALDHACLGAVAEMLGCMEAVLEISAQHLKTRVQFGKPLGAFQALQHRMAEMFLEVQETRSILYHGLSGLSLSAHERKRRASAAKAYAGSAARFVGQQGIQMHGGLGVTEEVAVGHYYRHIVALERLFGDSAAHVARFAAGYEEAA